MWFNIQTNTDFRSHPTAWWKFRTVKSNDCFVCNISDSSFQLFQGCTKLQTLDLSYCSRLGKSWECQALWTLPQTLKELVLCGIQFQDEQVFVEGIQRLKNIALLRLQGVPALNDNSLAQVSYILSIFLTYLM